MLFALLFRRLKDIVIPDQFLDRTKRRVGTFFGRALVAHVGFAHPVSADLSALALVTDSDCWHPDHDSVTVEMIIGNLLRNAKTAQSFGPVEI